METLATVLPIIIDVLLIVLLIAGIILLVKCIYIIDKAKSVILNVEEKVNSLNSLFSIIGMISDKVSGATEKAIISVENFLIKLFRKNKAEDLADEEDELREILEKERNE